MPYNGEQVTCYFGDMSLKCNYAIKLARNPCVIERFCSIFAFKLAALSIV